MAEIEKKTKRYPTDLTDEEWARIEPFLPGAAKSGRPVRTDLREVLNAIRYLARSGGGWRMLPKDFPAWPTVYWWFRRLVRHFLFQTIHDVAPRNDQGAPIPAVRSLSVIRRQQASCQVQAKQLLDARRGATNRAPRAIPWREIPAARVCTVFDSFRVHLAMWEADRAGDVARDVRIAGAGVDHHDACKRGLKIDGQIP
jgi:transposase